MQIRVDAHEPVCVCVRVFPSKKRKSHLNYQLQAKGKKIFIRPPFHPKRKQPQTNHGFGHWSGSRLTCSASSLRWNETGIPCIFPEGEVLPRLTSAWASTQSTTTWKKTNFRWSGRSGWELGGVSEFCGLLERVWCLVKWEGARLGNL